MSLLPLLFKNDAGEATGRCLALVLKLDIVRQGILFSGNKMALKFLEPQPVRQWLDHPNPVMLVVRNDEGEIHWMEISDHLKQVTNNGATQVRQIAFDGERFDVMSVRHWREKLLPPTLQFMYEALLDGYTRKAELERMVRFGLDQNLNGIVQDAPLQDMVFDLLKWAESRNELEKLMRAAHEQNLSNTKLASIVEKLALSDAG